MDIFKRWNAWEDVGIEFIQHEYKWVVIQTRTRKSCNKRQIRHIVIMRWGGMLSDNLKNSFNKIIGGKNV